MTSRPISALIADLAAHRITSVALVEAYEARIRRLNPRLHAVIAINPDALADAKRSDAVRRRGRPLGPLAGVPILIKDNIETADPMPTTAGSLALKHNVAGRDAPVVARLRAAGAIVLGKTNLSEWANMRDSHSISGWSAIGGQTHNPYALDRSPCGSSAGSAVGAAAGLAAGAVGTETNGSITCPAAVNGVVGLKPTVGLISRGRIVPISVTQDTAGPIGRTVEDVALLLDVMAASDPADPATAEADAHRQNYRAALSMGALKGVRVGVLRWASGFHPGTDAVFARSLATLRAAGAIPVDVTDGPDRQRTGILESLVLLTEFKAGVNAYLSSTDLAEVSTRTLADLIRFDRDHADAELSLFGQDQFDKAEATKGLDDPAYLSTRAELKRSTGPDGIDRLLAEHHVDVLVAPTLMPAWLIDPVLKDNYVGGGAGGLAAEAGYPHLTVPMGLVSGLPVGLSFIGARWKDAALLAYGYAFEQQRKLQSAPLP